MKILGIDPGLNTTGYGVIEGTVGTCGTTLLEGGVVRSVKDAAMAVKIKMIYDGVHEVIEQYRPDAVAIESLYSHYDRPTTAIMMGHARGVICLAAAQFGINVFPYAATKVKKMLTGSGHAPKDQMQRAIAIELALKKFPEPADVADALAIALCHFHHNKIFTNQR
ncbi:MAG: crossover junction endodeoxyribonuclease RuvC [Planctomycetaceae bacterium]|jgi:crossover junction endodeoxyribonuclease RuvC|nr:crossover junction endodeoxyribonuclease RuvC [Planctomycetaceae bacterium]